MDEYGALRPTYPTSRLCAVLLEDEFSDEPTGLPILKRVVHALPGATTRSAPSRATMRRRASSSTRLDLFPAMPDLTPSNAERLAEQALLRLLRPLREYQFDTSIRNADDTWNLAVNVGRTVAVSMFLSAVAVHATLTRPAYAPVFGSGKTILAELPALMCRSRAPAADLARRRPWRRGTGQATGQRAAARHGLHRLRQCARRPQK